MLLWLNPFKWWRTFQLKCRWKRFNSLFINSYHQQDWVAAESAAISMVDILAGSGLRSLLLDSHYSLMLCYRGMGRFDEAITQAELMLDLQRSLSTNPDDLRVLERMCDLADLYNLNDRTDDAARFYKKALAMQKRIDVGRGSHQLVDILESLSAIYVVQEQGDKAEKLFAEAQDHRRKLGLATDDDELGLAIKQIKSRHKGEQLTNFERWQKLADKAWMLYENGDIIAAISIAEQALELAENIFPDDDNNLVSSLKDLALMYKEKSRWAETESLFIRALAIEEKLSNNSSNNLANTLNDLALVHECQGNSNKAEALFIQALDIKEKLSDNSNSSNSSNNDLAIILSNLAGLYFSFGNYSKAEPLFIQALAIGKKILSTNLDSNLAQSISKDLSQSLDFLAQLYLNKHQPSKAEPLFTKALNIRKKLLGATSHPVLVDTLINLATAKVQLKKPDLDSALQLLQQAIAFENHWFTYNTPRLILEDLEKPRQHLGYLLELTQNHFSKDPAAITTAFNAVLNRKCQATNAEIYFSQAIHNHPDLTPQLQQLQTYQQDINTFSYRIGKKPELTNQLNKLEKQYSDLKQQLAKSIPAINTKQQVVDSLVLRTLLPANSFLIEFVCYEVSHFDNKEWYGHWFYDFDDLDHLNYDDEWGDIKQSPIDKEQCDGSIQWQDSNDQWYDADFLDKDFRYLAFIIEQNKAVIT
jgi:tetratricopeptide (TPR) repeat protein